MPSQNDRNNRIKARRRRLARGGRPSNQEAAAISDRILNAARDAFCRNGNEFSMDEIAHTAGVTKKAIYTRYAGKRDLLLAVVERTTGEFRDVGNRKKAARDPLKALRSWSWELFQRASDPKAIAFGVFLEAENLRSYDLLPAIRRPAIRARTPMHELVDRLWREGYLKTRPAPLVCEAFGDLIMQAAKRAWIDRLASDGQKRRAFARRWPIILSLLTGAK
jgi:AcrR family transcriptional regulator